MATSYDIQILIDAQNRASAELLQIKKDVDTLAKSTTKATSQINTAYNGVNKSIREFGERNKEAFRGMAVAGSIAFGTIAVGINKSISSATDLGESMNALRVVFGESSKSLIAFGETANKTVGLSKTAFNQLATPVGAMLQNMGQSADQAAESTIKLTQRASDMASVFNVDVREAMQAISAGLRGESDPLERFGVSLKDSQLQAYALANGIGAVGREMTEQEKTTARLGLLFQQTAKLEGDFKNTSDQLANSKRILSATIENINSKLGTAFIPIITEVLQKISPLITKVGERIEKNPTLARNIILVTAAVVGLVAILGTLGIALPAITTGIAGLGVVIGALTGPVGRVVLALGALFVAWKTNFGGIQDFTNTVLSAFTNAFKGDWQALFDDLVQIVINRGPKMLGPLGNILNSALQLVRSIKSAMASVGAGGSTNPATSAANVAIAGARARGGSVRGGSAYLVGENGPELFVPGASGSVIPNNQITNNTPINISLNGLSVRSNYDIEAIAESLYRKIELNRKFSIA